MADETDWSGRQTDKFDTSSKHRARKGLSGFRAGVFILLELISRWLSDVQADWQQFEEPHPVILTKNNRKPTRNTGEGANS